MHATSKRVEMDVNMSERLITMLELIRLNRSMSVVDLSQRFDVSEETIRRDIRQLEATGRVVKVHGGVRLSSSTLEPPYQGRVSLNSAAKKEVGEKATELVEDGMTVFIDCGSTSYWFSRMLTKPKKLLVVTNSLDVANEVIGRDDWRLAFTGGQIDPDYRAAFGREAILQARQFTPDLLFLSIGGIHSDIGLLDFSIDEANFKRSLLDRARRKVVLTDSSKFSGAGSVHLADFDQIDTLVCDKPPEDPLKSALDNAQVEVICSR